ncbi:MAG: D-amino-acid transaminase [Hyphomicrobiaceae bacterium]|nr:D-amino-acid transaminase [Hyphomicrobiaceae bacterium]
MTRIVYVNGAYRPYDEGLVHAEDRGFQFADAVYEVIEVTGGRLIDETRHMERLERSIQALGLPSPMTRGALSRVLRETVRRNRVSEGLVYLQVTRGARPRDFLFPPAGTPPTIVCLARSVPLARREAKAAKGIAILSQPDIRWRRSDIKTVMLLPASLAKEAARAAGCDDAWFVDAEGHVTEGASANAWIVDQQGRLVTRKLGPELLPGVTRRTLIDVLRREGLELVERPFTITEAQRAREAFISSATSLVMPVVSIDGVTIGNGAPGLLTLRLRSIFHEVAEAAAV